MSRPNWIGKTLSARYQIQEILGQGGMSAVYKALDPNLQRIVAVKMIHSHLSEDPKFISRFEEEARSVAQLRHPNFTQVFDFNHDGETYYMEQEFVPGETLAPARWVLPAPITLPPGATRTQPTRGFGSERPTDSPASAIAACRGTSVAGA